METMASQNKFVGRGVCVFTVALLATAAGMIAAQRPEVTKPAVPKPPAHERSARKTPATGRNSALAAARRRVLNAQPLAMYYYVGDARGRQSAQAHASQMTVLAPQCYWVEKDGVLRGALPPQVTEIAHRAHLPVMPLIFNRGFDRETVTALLHDPKAQQRAVSYMAYHAAREHFVGYQIDLENLDPADKDLFTEFVRSAAERMHREGRLLSVALVPKFSDVYPSIPTPENPTTGEWAAAYDYRALGGIADFLTLMTYDHFNRSTPAGPIAGFEWVKMALDFAEARIPPDKLLLGIALYGREWTETGSNTFSRSLTAQNIRELQHRWDSEARWDERWKSPWFQLQKGDATHTVWYEDSRSWTEKLNLIREHHLRGFAAWRLGFEGPDFWSLAAVKSPKPKPRAKRRPSTERAAKGSAKHSSQQARAAASH
jgi:spore germination protein YaaH